MHAHRQILSSHPFQFHIACFVSHCSRCVDVNIVYGSLAIRHFDLTCCLFSPLLLCNRIDVKDHSCASPSFSLCFVQHSKKKSENLKYPIIYIYHIECVINAALPYLSLFVVLSVQVIFRRQCNFTNMRRRRCCPCHFQLTLSHCAHVCVCESFSSSAFSVVGTARSPACLPNVFWHDRTLHAEHNECALLPCLRSLGRSFQLSRCFAPKRHYHEIVCDCIMSKTVDGTDCTNHRHIRTFWWHFVCNIKLNSPSG